MPDLTLYLPQKPQNNRNTASKTRSYLVIYSPVEATRTEVMNVARGIRGLNNGIIVVEEVWVEDL